VVMTVVSALALVAAAVVLAAVVLVATGVEVTVPEDRRAVLSDWLWLPPPPQAASADRQSIVDSIFAAGVCSVDFMAFSSGCCGLRERLPLLEEEF
jgi:hypothetical protein